MKVFLSHSTKTLAAELEAEKIEPWFCEVDIEWGANFVAKIEAGLRDADLTVLFWSPEAARSDWTRLEWTSVTAREISESRTRLGDVHCQRKKEFLERTDSHRIEQPPLLLGPCSDGAPQQVGTDHYRDGQTLHSLRKLKQRIAMFCSAPGRALPIGACREGECGPEIQMFLGRTVYVLGPLHLGESRKN
jgi:hypothetical protein